MLSRLSTLPRDSPVHFYCSSGGNAGLACVTAANTLSRPATIVVPAYTPASIIQQLRILGATVHQHGAAWQEADDYLHASLLAHDPHGVYVPPFDHPDIWAGNATCIDEVVSQLPTGAAPFDAVICSVGGGGLLAGVVQSVDRHAHMWNDYQQALPTVLAVETLGAESLNESVKAGKLVTLPKITSIAKSLGAVRVAAKALECGLRDHVRSAVLDDADAARAAVRFVGDERMVVEASCAVSLAPVYMGRERLGKMLGRQLTAKSRVVVVVCGGSHVSLEVLEGYKRTYGEMEEPSGEISAEETPKRGEHATEDMVEFRSQL